MPILESCLRVAIVGAVAFSGGIASAAYDFSGLTALAEGALVGENVDHPVAGFEIRLLRDGEPLYHEVFGAWSLDRPANADSSTKTLSGALILSVVDSGDAGFSLDTHLADLLPEYDDPGYRDVTIRQAFSHTSGIAGDEQSQVLQDPNITLREAASQIRQIPLAYVPGTTFAYGGLSMQAAGAALEVATSEAFVDLMADRITGPLGMTNTRFVLASQTNPRVAGGVESTATEFGRFMDMLANGGADRATGTRILAEASVSEMLTRQTNDGQAIGHSPSDNDRYGIGVWVDQLGRAGPTVDALAAGARGFHAWIDRSHGLVFVFATDLSHFQDLETLSSMMHAEILETVPEPDSSWLYGACLLTIAASRAKRRPPSLRLAKERTAPSGHPRPAPARPRARGGRATSPRRMMSASSSTVRLAGACAAPASSERANSRPRPASRRATEAVSQGPIWPTAAARSSRLFSTAIT